MVRLIPTAIRSGLITLFLGSSLAGASAQAEPVRVTEQVLLYVEYAVSERDWLERLISDYGLKVLASRSGFRWQSGGRHSPRDGGWARGLNGRPGSVRAVQSARLLDAAAAIPARGGAKRIRASVESLSWMPRWPADEAAEMA